MADFRLGRLKFNWRGAWAPSTAYVIDDIVSFKGNTYVCVVNHTSAASQTAWASTDLNIANPRWQLHVPGVRNLGAWNPNTFYAVNDIIAYGANQYLCTANHTSAANENLFYSSDVSNWSLFASSTTYKGEWSSGAWYKLNDIVKYGNILYLTATAHTSGGAFDLTKFNVYLESINFEDSWVSTLEYQPGDIVTFGGYSYIADTINLNKQPNLYAADWKIVTTGFTAKGDYDNTTVYIPGDVVIYGGNTFVKIDSSGAGNKPQPVNAGGIIIYYGWELIGKGLAWKQNWDSSTTYQVNDVVKKGTGSYVSLIKDNTNNDPEVDNGTKWQALAQGDSVLTLSLPGDILIRNTNGNVRLPIGTQGEILTVTEEGLPGWERNNWCANVYYVATDGVDDSDYGRNISKPWKTLRYALSQIPSGTADNVNTIFVKSGTYEEQLPLVTEPYTSIIGDNLRATIIKPKSTGLSTDSTPVENRFSTMFFLSESVTLKDLVLVGMEGFTPAIGAQNSWDITQATIRGVFFRLHPFDPITGKSPYITQCSALSGRPVGSAPNCTGGVGAIVDKSIYGDTNSNGSMLFDSFTQIHDGGVGFWCKDLGNAEIVSSFTYYCHIGYTCSGGGRIRSLAGNNSYGTYGCVSSGTDAAETPITGTVRGQRLNFAYRENSPKFKKGELVVQGVENEGVPDFTETNPEYALALILYTQNNYLLIEPITGTFGNDLPIKGISSENVVGSNALADTPLSGALAGITGKIFTISNLPVVNNEVVLPKPTGSTEFLPISGQSQFDDDRFYVIKTVTDPATATDLTLTTLRRYDVPGTAPSEVLITTFSYNSSTGVVTMNTSAAHGLTTGDLVTVTIANPTYQAYATVAFQRTTVTSTPSGTQFTYQIATGLAAVSPAVAVSNSKVYKSRTSGGSTKAVHSGGTSITHYDVSNIASRMDRAATQEMDTVTTQITFADNNVFDQLIPGPNQFVLINNELMRVTAKDAGSGIVTVVRGQEGTSAAAHADGSWCFAVTKIADATTTRGDVDTVVNNIPVFSVGTFAAQDIIKIQDEFFRITSVNSQLVGRATILFSQPKDIAASNGQSFEIRLNYSQVRLTGHDFLLIGTGNKTQTNWPNQPLQQANQENEVYEDYPGRVYYVSTDQDGNFRVGPLFRVEQATGTATLDANAFDLSGLSSLRLGSIGAQLGAEINEFSIDVTLGGDFSRDTACPTQLAVKTYVDAATGSGLLRNAPIIGVSALESSGTTATVTSFVPNNVYVGDEVIISGADQANYNGRFTVTEINVSENQFSYVMPGTAISPATGIIGCERVQKISTDLDTTGNLRLRPTWNDSQEVFESLDIRVTDTASQITSKVIDAQVNNSSVFNVDKSGNIYATGNLTVAGSTTTVSSTNLTISDKQIVIGSESTNASQADGAGIVVGTSSKQFLFDNGNSRWNLSDALNIGGQLSISGTSVLTSTTLGSDVVNSSLTSLGTLTGLNVDGICTFETVAEKFQNINGATGTTAHDFTVGSIFYHTGLLGNFVANFTSFPTTADRAYAVTLVLVQGGTPRIPTAIQVNGGANITITWANGSTPTGNANKTDIVSLSVINRSGTYTVLGQLSSFG